MSDSESIQPATRIQRRDSGEDDFSMSVTGQTLSDVLSVALSHETCSAIASAEYLCRGNFINRCTPVKAPLYTGDAFWGRSSTLALVAALFTAGHPEGPYGDSSVAAGELSTVCAGCSRTKQLAD